MIRGPRQSGVLTLWLLLCWLAAPAAAAPTVFVSILPQKFFVEQIGGDHFTVEVMVPPGASPHTYEPKPSQMRKLAGARAYLTIGIALEDAWLERIAAVNPGLVVVHTEAGIKRLAMVGDHHHDDDEGGGYDGAHEAEDGLDPHIWLSPSLVARQAAVIRDSLVALDPGNGAVYQDNYQRFRARIDQLDSRLKTILAGKQGMKFMVFHPSWGYFADTYGLEQVPVEIEGKSPKSAHIQELIELARSHSITIIFAQPQFSRKSVEVIAREIGARVVLIDPLGEDWFANMTLVAEELSAALR